MAKILPNAEAGQLLRQGEENENSEAIDLIVGAYEKMAEKVLLRGSANHPEHLQVVVYKKCGEDEDYVKCEGNESFRSLLRFPFRYKQMLVRESRQKRKGQLYGGVSME